MITKTISEICLVNPRMPTSLALQKDRDVDFVPMANVGEDGRIAVNGSRKLHEVQKGYTYFQNGDVIVAKITPCMENGKAAYVRDLPNDVGFGSTEFHVLRPQDGLDPAYLFHMIWSPFFRREAARNMTGTAGQQRVPTTFFDRFKIPLPPLPKQRRIADILDKADAIRRKRQEAKNMADDVIPSLFREMFGDPRTNRYDLKKKPLRELIRVKSGEFLPQKNMNADGPHAVYGGNGINGRHNEFLFEEPRIVIGRVGVYCGAIHVTEPKSWITDNALYVVEKSDELIDSYLAEALRFANLNQYASQSGQPLISGSRIESVEILVPPKSLQLKFAGANKEISQLIDCTLAYAATHTDDLFNSLVQRAFRGEL